MCLDVKFGNDYGSFGEMVAAQFFEAQEDYS